MKKFIAVIAALGMCFTLMAAASPSATTPTPEPTPSIEEPEYETRTVIFRFVDDKGATISDDIVTTKRVVVNGVQGELMAASIEEALAQYETVKASLSANYDIVTDEVAAHTGEWFGNTTDPVVYTVTMKAKNAVSAGTPTATPTPAADASTSPTTGDFVVPALIAIAAVGATVAIVAKKKQA